MTSASSPQTTATRPYQLTSEQQAMARELRNYLSLQWPVSRVRELADGVPGGQLDRRTRTEGDALGISALLVPTAYGGLGGGQVDLGLVCEELGYGLYPGPAFSTVAMATNALLLWGEEDARRDLLPVIAAGDFTATVGLLEEPGDWAASRIGLRAEHKATEWTLTGTKTLVIDGRTADLILVVGRTSDGLSLFAVEPNARGLTAVAMDVLDASREIAALTFADVPARLLSGDISGLIEPFLDRVNTALAAEQVGVSQRCLAMSVEHAKVRVQFGRPIGSFQAVKHKCADMLLAVETARAAVGYAAWSLDTGRPEGPRAASIAAAHACGTGPRVAADTIQVHGGMGFTWECDAHLYYKRATADAVLFGDADHHYQQLFSRLGLGTQGG
jgi:alkylation response protein AidB-like acyl-CoA dehydrogenase